MLIIQRKVDESVFIKELKYKLVYIQNNSCIINISFEDRSLTLSYKYNKWYNIPEGRIKFIRRGKYVRFCMDSKEIIRRSEL